MSLALELENIHELRVKSTSPVKKLAAAIATNILAYKRVILSAIGAGANNQAIKAVIIARQYLIASNIELSILPAFHSNFIDNGNGNNAEPAEEGAEAPNNTDSHTVIRHFLKVEYGK